MAGVEWKNAGGLLQKAREPLSSEDSVGAILHANSDSFDSGVVLKVHASKKYSNGTLLGYGLSTDKKTRVWQHIDSAGASKSNKEAYGILILGEGVEDFEYKATTEKKTFQHFRVLARNAVVKSNWLTVDPISDLGKCAQQLELNSNIKVIFQENVLSDIQSKPGDVT